MKAHYRMHPILMLTASLTLVSAPLQANDLDEFVFSPTAVNTPQITQQAAQGLKAPQPADAPTAIPAAVKFDAEPILATSNPVVPNNVDVADAADTTTTASAAKLAKKSKKRLTNGSATLTAPATLAALPATPQGKNTAKKPQVYVSTVTGGDAQGAPNPELENIKNTHTAPFLALFSKRITLNPVDADSAPAPTTSTGGDSTDSFAVNAENSDTAENSGATVAIDTSSPNYAPGSLWKSAQEIAVSALGLLGVHYRLGGNTPESGLDCSGFVRYVFQQVLDIKLPRSSREISRVGEPVDRDGLIPGDLVFFNTRKFAFSHVGIYLGDNRFIHSPRTGKDIQIVRITDRYWSTRFNGGRRILGQVAMRAPQK